MQPTLLNNRYQIIRTLGRGGFGETFLAEDTHLPSSRRCVIKQLKPIINNPQVYQLVRERFGREAAILEELGEGNNQIPSLYAYFSEGGEFYLVQEWIEGEPLNLRVQQQGKFSESSVKEILINILSVLDYVHSKRIVHRDIKPDNIMLRSWDGKPVLIDFGAVKETMGTVVNSQGNTTSSIVIGTPGFMPSEQAAGRPVYSSDLYSLGLTAIYLLTGKMPQLLETDSRTGEIVWHHDARQISPSLAAVLDKAIMSHPRDRFPTAQAMLEALQSNTTPIAPTLPPPEPMVHDSGVPLSPTVQSTQPPSPQNNSKTIILGSLIAGGLIGGSIIIGFAMTKSQQIVTQRTPSPSPSKAAPTETPKSEPPQVTPTRTPTPIPPVSQDFYFVADSAFPDANSAEVQVSKLKGDGYKKAGSFWIPDYPNLSGKLLFQVYPAKFSDRTSCANFLSAYSQRNTGVYCFFGSKDANASTDRFYSDYSWLSEIQITDAYLEGRTAFELSIMRNSIFARHGRRFVSPQLQEYFNSQSWYRPLHLPGEFSNSLLSPLERKNAFYILQYQNRNNLRWIK
ncbi:MAG: YARHG domain-containing protein [Xenococcaceae cyanobacterium]